MDNDVILALREAGLSEIAEYVLNLQEANKDLTNLVIEASRMAKTWRAEWEADLRRRAALLERLSDVSNGGENEQ